MLPKCPRCNVKRRERRESSGKLTRYCLECEAELQRIYRLKRKTLSLLSLLCLRYKLGYEGGMALVRQAAAQQKRRKPKKEVS